MLCFEVPVLIQVNLVPAFIKIIVFKVDNQNLWRREHQISV